MGDTVLLEIGRVGKAHGLRGEVTAVITSDRPERTEPGACWHLDAGPVTVRSTRRVAPGRWVVGLVGVSTREEAEALRGQVIRAEAIEDPAALWVHELVGASVETPDGRSWGRVAAVLANPASDLLELESGVLVPVVFVIDTAGLPGVVVIDPPPGLLDGG